MTQKPELQSITESHWDKSQSIMVSIQCITYNQEDYIRDALDGFLMQKTNFPVEILIHDDASTDKTADIIREYEQKYPDLILPIYQKENVASKNNVAIGEIQRTRAKGKYFAICEGDDYWTDPLKLQKQVDFMEAHKNLVMCMHNAQTLNAKGEFGKYFRYKKLKDKSIIPKKQFIAKGGGGFPTASIMMRADLFESIPSYFTIGASPDFCIALHSITQGEIGYLQDEMSVYRLKAKGSWSSNTSKEFKLEHSKNCFLALDKFHEYTDFQFKETCAELKLNLKYLHYRYLCMQENKRSKLKIILPSLFDIGLIRFSMLLYFEFIKTGTL